MSHLLMYNFIILCPGHLENTCSVNYAYLPNVDTFYDL